VKDFSKGHFYTYMRLKYNVIRRDRLYSLVQELNPNAVTHRRKKTQVYYSAFIVLRLNYI
ncbi:hypothetical protein K431DRAFT_236808, partial [Polychaeton citri CBS 116435]